MNGRETKPNVFIVGAPKSGTTLLYHFLNNHPQAYMSVPKETNYFSYAQIKKQNLYYGAEKIHSLEQYEELFLGAKNQHVIGEGSVSYLFYPNVAQDLFKYNSNANIVVLLRNPAERAISHYLMDSRLGFIQDSIEDIFYKKSKHKNAHLWFQQVFELGLYSAQLKRYFDCFPKEKIHIFFYDEIKKDSGAFFSEICKKLNLADVEFNFSSSNRNAFEAPKGKALASLYKSERIRQLSKLLIPKSLVRKIKETFFSKEKPAFSEQFLTDLNTYYADSILELESMLDRPLDQWKSK
jgi:hypothetical protein